MIYVYRSARQSSQKEEQTFCADSKERMERNPLFTVMPGKVTAMQLKQVYSEVSLVEQLLHKCVQESMKTSRQDVA